MDILFRKVDSLFPTVFSVSSGSSMYKFFTIHLFKPHRLKKKIRHNSGSITGPLASRKLNAGPASEFAGS